jgi:hypothetical protein
VLAALQPSPDVRFTPKSGHLNSAARCPLCANSGLMHRKTLQRYGWRKSRIYSLEKLHPIIIDSRLVAGFVIIP